MSLSHPIVRVPAPLALWAAAGGALLVSHDLIYLVQLGPGRDVARALRDIGHGYWGWASLALALAGVAAMALMALRVRRLRRRASALGATPANRPGSYRGRWLATWARLLVIVAAAFVLQESVEHFISHGHLLGLGALVGPEYPLAVPVIAAITGVAALAVAAAAHVERALLAAIAGALDRARRPDVAPGRPRDLPPSARPSPMASAAAGRAPPPMVALIG